MHANTEKVWGDALQELLQLEVLYGVRTACSRDAGCIVVVCIQTLFLESLPPTSDGLQAASGDSVPFQDRDDYVLSPSIWICARQLADQLQNPGGAGPRGCYSQLASLVFS